MSVAGSRPHVSLTVCDGVDADSAAKLLEKFAARTACFPISFSRVGVFPGEAAVIYLAPKPDAFLQHLQKVFSSEFSRMAKSRWNHYEPKSWVPHCTLVGGIESSAVAEMMERCKRFDLPIDAMVCEIGLLEFRPVRLLGSFLLTPPG